MAVLPLRPESYFLLKPRQHTQDRQTAECLSSGQMLMLEATWRPRLRSQQWLVGPRLNMFSATDHITSCLLTPSWLPPAGQWGNVADTNSKAVPKFRVVVLGSSSLRLLTFAL